MKERNQMEPGDLLARKDAVSEALLEVASKIQPLPADVKPSDEFLKRTRLRILQLPGNPRSSARRAA
jgi:hypothetical protein